MKRCDGHETPENDCWVCFEDMRAQLDAVTKEWDALAAENGRLRELLREFCDKGHSIEREARARAALQPSGVCLSTAGYCDCGRAHIQPAPQPPACATCGESLQRQESWTYDHEEWSAANPGKCWYCQPPAPATAESPGVHCPVCDVGCDCQPGERGGR